MAGQKTEAVSAIEYCSPLLGPKHTALEITYITSCKLGSGTILGRNSFIRLCDETGYNGPHNLLIGRINY